MKLKPLNLFKEKPKVEKGNFYQSRYWKQIRRTHLKMYPLCKLCEDEGITKIANTVDHIIPRGIGGHDYVDNLQSLCTRHHQMKSSIEGRNKMYENNPKWQSGG